VFPVAALFMLLAFSGCVEKDVDVWEQDKPIILESIQQTQTDHSAVNAKMEAMEARVFELEKSVKKQEAENIALAANLKSLRRKKTRKKPSAKVSKKDQKLVTKLNKIESNIHSPTIKGVPVIQPSAKSIEKNSYTAAYLALKSGRYEEAAIGFKSLLNDYPQGEYADQAYFWLGESYLAQHKTEEAITALKKIASDYPDSAKHPAALLRLASAYQESGHRGDAKAALQRLIKQHPESNAAEQARTQLKAIDTGKNK
ncbi:MAG: tol-pal system protein YbgF, partial [Mariprofundaceae bacterium]